MGNFLSFLDKNSPGLFLGTGIAMMVLSTFEAAVYSPDAREAIENKKEELGVEKLEIKDVIKTAGPYYLPSILTSCAGIACILKSNQLVTKRGAAAMAAYALSESALREYRDKVHEELGERKVKSIEESIAGEKMKKNPIEGKEVIVTGKGEALCYDTISGRYFKSDIERIKMIVNNLNRRMLTEMSISLNEYYLCVGLDPVELGEELVWHIDKGYIDPRFSAQLTDDGTPCIVIDFDIMPKHFPRI